MKINQGIFCKNTFGIKENHLIFYKFYFAIA